MRLCIAIALWVALLAPATALAGNCAEERELLYKLFVDCGQVAWRVFHGETGDAVKTSAMFCEGNVGSVLGRVEEACGDSSALKQFERWATEDPCARSIMRKKPCRCGVRHCDENKRAGE